jgi:uncharacterized protein
MDKRKSKMWNPFGTTWNPALRGSTSIVLHFALCTFIFCVAGCNPPANALMKFNSLYMSDAAKASDFTKSEQFAISKAGKSGKNPNREDLLWSLQLGSIARSKQDYNQSNEYFDRSEEMLGYFDYQNTALDSSASIAVNENLVPYTGREYDGIMVNTYKALNFMALGNKELARVEFNRAQERQQRATKKFASEITKLQKELDSEKAKKDSQADRNVNNKEIQQIINQRYSNLEAYKAYPDFVNPFTTYLAGVFFALDGDYSKADSLLKEAYGMVEDNPYIAEDLAEIEKVLDSQTTFNNTVWVIFENGMGPIKEEIRVDLPLFVATKEVKYVGIALPQLSFRAQAYPYLTIQAAGHDYQTRQVASMDRVIKTEFDKDFKGILTRAIISTTAKAVAQYALEKQQSSSGTFASVLMAVYSFATTAADVRIWTTLPKDFQVARFSIPDDRTIYIAAPGGGKFEVKIPACKNAMVYVRIPFRGVKPVYNVMEY